MLSESKFQRLMSSQTNVAKKVYNVVPQQEVWDIKQIASELVRLHQALDFQLLGGALDTLARAGLIQEVGKNRFMREPIRKKPPALPPAEPITITGPSMAETKVTIPLPLPPKTALDKLAILSKKFASIGAEASSLAKQLEDIALEVEEQIQKGSSELQSLRQLRTLLKSVTDGAG